MCSLFENILRQFVDACLRDSHVAVVEQQTGINEMKLCRAHARKTKSRPTKGSSNLGFVSVKGLVQPLIFVVGRQARLKLDILACSLDLHLDSRFVDR